MKKTGKAGLGHHTKMEKISRQMAAGRAVMAAKEGAAKTAHKPRRHCG
jgi:hypothetical protein